MAEHWPPRQHVMPIAHTARGPAATRTASATLEDAEAAVRKGGLYRFTWGELEAADVSVQDQRGDPRLEPEADAGERAGAEDLLDACG